MGVFQELSEIEEKEDRDKKNPSKWLANCIMN